jgi:hypothetical protein
MVSVSARKAAASLRENLSDFAKDFFMLVEYSEGYQLAVFDRSQSLCSFRNKPNVFGSLFGSSVFNFSRVRYLFLE